MPKVSPIAAQSEPKSSGASGAASRNKRSAIFAAAINAKVEEIRVLVANEATHGFNADLAAAMLWRRERISREIQGVEKLSVALFLAEVQGHREAGRDAVADRLVSIINNGQPMTIRTDRAVVIRISDGQMFLDLQS